MKALVGAPYRVVVDDQGNLYVGSRDCGCIRMIGRRRMISTIAGTGTLGFSGGDGGPATRAQLAPTGMAFGPDGALYLATAFPGDRVRKIVFP